MLESCRLRLLYAADTPAIRFAIFAADDADESLATALMPPPPFCFMPPPMLALVAYYADCRAPRYRALLSRYCFRYCRAATLYSRTR